MGGGGGVDTHKPHNMYHSRHTKPTPGGGERGAAAFNQSTCWQHTHEPSRGRSGRGRRCHQRTAAGASLPDAAWLPAHNCRAATQEPVQGAHKTRYSNHDRAHTAGVHKVQVCVLCGCMRGGLALCHHSGGGGEGLGLPEWACPAPLVYLPLLLPPAQACSAHTRVAAVAVGGGERTQGRQRCLREGPRSGVGCGSGACHCDPASPHHLRWSRHPHYLHAQHTRGRQEGGQRRVCEVMLTRELSLPCR